MTNEVSHPVARFQLYGTHELIVRSNSTVTCGTCSLSATIAKAAVFAYENGIIRMTIDGADLKRI